MSDTLMTGSPTPSDAAASPTPAVPVAASAAPEAAGTPAVADPAAEAAAAEAAKVAPEPGSPEALAAAEAAKAEGDKAAEKPAGAPEAYEPFAMPEGVELDADLNGEFQGIAKELNLPQEAAQKVANLGAKMVQKMAEAQTAANAQAVKDWQAETTADPEIGGDKLPANLALANKAVDAFGSAKFKELLKLSGLGNNTEFIRAFVQIGKAISEDTLVTGGGGAAPAKDAASKLYPEQGK
jgi:hypothetical protein